MASSTDTDRTGTLPPRLSEQQQFILAALVDDEEHEGLRSVEWLRKYGWYRGYQTEALSIAVAKEFDEDGDRISPHPGCLEARADELRAEGEEFAAYAIEASLWGPNAHFYRDRHVTGSHSSSFSRALDRLEDRGLIAARHGAGERQDRRVWVYLTDAGRAAGREVLRRCGDGRYSLSFDTLRVR